MTEWRAYINLARNICTNFIFISCIASFPSVSFRLLSLVISLFCDDFILFPVLHDHAEEQSSPFAKDSRSTERIVYLPVPFRLIMSFLRTICRERVADIAAQVLRDCSIRD
jgi:hypothetical protein